MPVRCLGLLASHGDEPAGPGGYLPLQAGRSAPGCDQNPWCAGYQRERWTGLCDIYKLYTRGPSAGGKAAIAFGEVAADIFTLGLAEVVFTPIEAGTKHGKHTITICYDTDEKMTKLEESEVATD